MVQPGWIAARTPPGFHHRLFTPLQPATAGTPASDRRRCPKRRETAYRRSPAEAARRQSPEESGENPPQQNRPPPTFVPIRGVPPRENRTFEGLRRPPARRAEPGTRRTAARLSPTPERCRRPEVRRLFSPLQSHPAAGAWLSLAEHLVRDQGVAGSNPAAPTRPVPQTVPADGFRPDGFPQTGSADGFRQTGFGPEAATASGRFGRIFPRPFPPRKGVVISALTHGSKRVYSGALAGDSSSRRVPFFLLLLLDIPKSGVMELARMFALSAPAHSLVSVRSEPYFAGFLPLDPVAHILAARLAGAGTRRFALSYRRWE